MKGSIALILTTSVAVEAYSKQELVLQDPAVVGERVLTKRPHEYLREEDLPASLDYRDQGLLTMDLNQHIPVYCGSCWAHSAFSSIADRLKIQSKGKRRDIIPSIQALINCGDAGTCQGGDSNAANAWVAKNGIPDLTCQQYQSKNMECSPINMCMNCDHDTNECSPIYNYPEITVSEYGTAVGDHAIMAEIFARGPLSAYIDATCIEDYKGGINMYDTCSKVINHAIQLNGWGSENGTDYWIGRNSWGTYWGDDGFFKIVRGGSYKPKQGYWAVPSMAEYN